MIRVLAVCAGNTCRSPVAEAAIQAAAETRQLDVDVDSAGTGAWHVGEPPNAQAVAAGSRVGLSVSGKARTFIQRDFERFDLILVMDSTNLRDISKLARNAEDLAKVRLFRTYDPSTDEDTVPDPYGGSDEDYDRAVGQIVAAAEGLAASLTPQP